MSNIYYWENSSQNLSKSKSLGKKGTRNIRGNVHFGIIVFSCLLSIKPCLIFLLICFARKIKGFYQSSLVNEVDFREIMNVSSNILAKDWNFKNLRHGLVDERALITTTLISSCHWKTVVPFYLRKERSISKNRKEKQIMPCRSTINWLFNDIWCYLFNTCFDWEIGVFQQIVVGVYHILKGLLYRSVCIV